MNVGEHGKCRRETSCDELWGKPMSIMMQHDDKKDDEECDKKIITPKF